MSKKKLFASVFSDTGVSRKINQDNFYLDGNVINDCAELRCEAQAFTNGGVFVVADGMGGESNGEFASFTAVSEFRKLEEKDEITAGDIDSVVNSANNIICGKIKQTGKNIGTTVVAAVIHDNEVDVYNIGDSKCFLYNCEGKLIKLTKDHTLTAQMLENKMITEEQAKNDLRKHQLLQHLGISPDEMVLSVFKQNRFTLNSGEILLLCSDGLTDELDDDKLADIIKANKDHNIASLANKLVNAAVNAGSKDNITAMVISALCDRNDRLKKIIYILECLCSAALGAVSALLLLNLI